MAVGVHGDGDVGVPEPLADDLGRDPSRQRCSGIAVANIMQADLRQPRHFLFILKAGPAHGGTRGRFEARVRRRSTRRARFRHHRNQLSVRAMPKDGHREPEAAM